MTKFSMLTRFLLKRVSLLSGMAFFTSSIDTLKVLVIALGAGLGVWGVIDLLKGYGNGNRATRS